MTLDYRPYLPRATGWHGVREHAGHHLKVYSVRYGDAAFELDDYVDGVDLALSSLPRPDPRNGRPGLGFVVVHRGRGMDYVVLGWWDRENELPIRVFVREEGPWRPARGGESFCVWDLEIIGHERDAYVETVLDEDQEGAAGAYLERVATAP